MTLDPSPFRGSRVLVTGGAGFVGSALAHRLVDAGADVTVVDAFVPDTGANPFNLAAIADRIQLHVLDMSDEAAMVPLVQDRQFVFNVAGQVSHIDSMLDPYQDLAINCRAQLGLLEACRKHAPETKILYAGTRQQYGRPEYLPVDERHPLNPTDVNGIHKSTAEAYHFLYGRVYGLRITSLRLTNTYGPRQLMRHNRQGFVPWFIRLAIEGGDISVFGDGSQTRDFTFVDDVVDAFLVAALRAEADQQVFNLGGPHVYALRDFVDALLAISGNGVLCRYVPFPEEKRRIDIGSFHADMTKIRTTLGWQPRVGLEEGLRRTVEYYRRHREHYW